MLENFRRSIAMRLRHKAMEMRHKEYEKNGPINNPLDHAHTHIERWASWINPDNHAYNTPPAEMKWICLIGLAILGVLWWALWG